MNNQFQIPQIKQNYSFNALFTTVFLSRRVVVEATKHSTYFSVSHIYTHPNNQTNSTVFNLQLIS